MSDPRLPYLVYRCYRCARPLSRLEILDAWAASKEKQNTMGVCPCGSRHITPSNLTPEESETLLSQETQDAYDAGLRDHTTRFVHLVHTEKDQELDSNLYPEGWDG